MFKLLTTATIATLSAVGLSASAYAQVDEHGCPEGTTWTQTAGVPLCLAPIWLDGTWNDDPRACLHGWYQGSCAPEPQSPADLPVDAYLFQMDDPSPEYVAGVEAKRAMWGSVTTTSQTEPVDAAEAIVAPVAALWLSRVELLLADLRGPR